MNRPVIGFAGMSHLGLVSSIASAEKGYHVICFDPDAGRIEALRRKNLPVIEPDLPELFDSNQERLTFSENVGDLSKCHVVYIAQDVPTDNQGQSDLGPIGTLVDLVGQSLCKDAVMVILSQVPPGFTRSRLRPGKLLYYQVETLIFGRAVERALHPERFIIGCANPELPLPPLLTVYLKSYDCPILPIRYEGAELAKISINMCLVASVSVANVMAEICEHIGADWSEVVPALRLDRRIGQYSYINPGLGISGGNLERDLATVLRLSESHGTDAGIVSAWLKNSHHRKEWAWNTFKNLGLDKKPGARIALLGLTYKENTHSLQNSPALIFLSHLTEREVVAFDPAAAPESVGPKVFRTSTALEAVKGADVLAIMTPWSEFRLITPEILVQNMAGRVVIDPYRMLDGKALKAKGFIYATLGASINE